MSEESLISLTVGLGGKVKLTLPSGEEILIKATRMNGTKETRLSFKMPRNIKANRVPGKETMEEVHDNIGNTIDDEKVLVDEKGRLRKRDWSH